MSFRSKNILIVAHHYPPHVSGVGFVAQNQAKRLAAMGHTVTVITSETSKKEKSYSADDVKVVRVRALNFTERWGVPFPVFSPRLIFVAFGLVKSADIVHIHDVFYTSSLCFAIAARFYKKPILVTQHVAMIAHPWKFVVLIEKLVYATTGRMIFRFSDKVLTYNKRVEEFLISIGVEERKMFAVMNGVDTELFHPVTQAEKIELRKKLGFSLDKKIVLFVGRFVPKKGFDKVLAIRGNEYQIVCVGGKSIHKELEGVIFLGEIDQSKLVSVYQAADLFLLPSEGEGFPLSIQEAMASGLPIITRHDRGYSEYGFDEKFFYLLKEFDEATLRRVVGAAIHDESLLASMGEYSRKYSLENFSWSLALAQLDGIYNDLLALRKARVAIVSDAVYPYNKGGKEKRIYEISTRLVAAGHDVTIYCMKWWEGEDTVVNEGVKFHAISSYHDLYTGSRRSIKEAIFFSISCLKMLSQKFDVVDIDHMPQLVIFTMKIVCLIKRKRMIVTWHEVWGRDYWKEYLGTLWGEIGFFVEKVSAKIPDTIIAVSVYTADRLRVVLRRDKETVVVTNGVNIGAITKNLPPEQTSDVLFVGRLLPNKNVDVLVRAISILKADLPTVRLCIVGEGPEKARLEELTASSGLESNVNFVGFLDDNSRVYGIMKASKVFVFPSTREGFGIVALEANACGLPVVTIDHEQNATRGLIVNGENGILTPLDEKEIAAAVKKLLANRKDAGYYRKYAEKYDWGSLVKGIEKAYSI